MWLYFHWGIWNINCHGLMISSKTITGNISYCTVVITAYSKYRTLIRCFKVRNTKVAKWVKWVTVLKLNLCVLCCHLNMCTIDDLTFHSPRPAYMGGKTDVISFHLRKYCKTSSNFSLFPVNQVRTWYICTLWKV